MKESPKWLNIYEQLSSGLRDLNFGKGLHLGLFCVGSIIEGAIFVACNRNCLCCLQSQSMDKDKDSDQNIEIRLSSVGYVRIGVLRGF